MSSYQETVQTFHEHFNAGRADEVLAMASDDISVGGARGKGAGKQFLEEWVRRATTTMTPRRWFQQDNVVVIEEFIEWRSRQTGRVTDSTLWGIAFTVVDGKITALARYADIGEAVYKAGLDASHEIAVPE